MLPLSNFLKNTFFLFFLFTCFNSSGQGTLSGKITDEKNEPLTGAIAELRNAKDSSLAKVNASDASGQFLFMNVKPGSYFLKASLISFTPYRSAPFSFDGSSTEIPVITLASSAITLKQANVTGIRPLIEIRSDKTVFNVENSINSTGSTAFELLQKAPGVVVDNNDNISLKGRGGVLVQLDGKDLRLTETELGDYLRSIQSTEVESIELISNPSSKYDAEGTAGIINIRLKKNKNYGTNGTVTLGYAIGIFAKYNTAISLNNRSKKFNVYSSYSNNWGERQNEFYLYREQNPFKFNQSAVSWRHGLSHNYKAGVDYTMSRKNSVGIMVNGNNSRISGNSKNRNYINNFVSDATDSILKSDQTFTNRSNNININLNHHYNDTLGHDLVTDFDYGYYDSNRDNYQPNIYTSPDEITVLSSNIYRTVTPTTINIYTLKSDYSQNLWKGKLGLGYKVSLVNTDNTLNFYNIDNTGEHIDNTRSNHFVYDENVYAAYLNYQKTIKKFDFQAGVRMENTQSEGDLKSASDTAQDKNVKRNYTDFFPSGGLTYNMSKDHSFGLVYSTRIDRPNYQELNPFEYKLDELSFRKGNPFLNPQYSNKIELSHTYKYTITTSAGYSHTRDFFAQITDTIPGGKSHLTPRNLATEDVWSLNISASLQPMQWYNFYANAGVNNQHYKADFGNNKTIDASVNTFSFYGQNTFKLPMNFTFEISGWYNTGGVWGGSFIGKPLGSLDLGLQKKFFKDQATLKITVTDIFQTAPWDSRNAYAGIVINARGNWESRQFRAALTWRFGNRQMKALRQRTAGSESEQKRVGGGE